MKKQTAHLFALFLFMCLADGAQASVFTGIRVLTSATPAADISDVRQLYVLAEDGDTAATRAAKLNTLAQGAWDQLEPADFSGIKATFEAFHTAYLEWVMALPEAITQGAGYNYVKILLQALSQRVTGLQLALDDFRVLKDALSELSLLLIESYPGNHYAQICDDTSWELQISALITLLDSREMLLRTGIAAFPPPPVEHEVAASPAPLASAACAHQGWVAWVCDLIASWE
jgi:hypothetical protein